MSTEFRLTGLNNLNDKQALRQHLIENGCFSTSENDRIFKKWFANSPRYLFRAVASKYDLSTKTICDIGCGYGMNLCFVQPGSYGLEIEAYPAKFAASIGLKVFQRDIFDDISDLPQVDVVWSSAVMEHVESPHIFMRKVYQLLRDDGIAIIFVPTIPLIPWLSKFAPLRRYLTGHLHPDHINAFTPETLQFTCEFAGFKTLEVSPFYPGIAGLFNHVPLANRIIDGCIYVGRKIANWEYHPSATRRRDNNAKGFRYVGDTGYPTLDRETCES